MDLQLEKAIEIPRKMKIYLGLLIVIVLFGGLIFAVSSWNDAVNLRTLEKEKRQLEKVAANAQTELKTIQAEQANANANLQNLEKKEEKVNEIHKQTRVTTDNARHNYNAVRNTKRTDNPHAAQLCEELEREHQIKCQ